MSDQFNKIPLVFTCDIDWAPEFVLKDTINFFSNLGIELTLFATHDSEAAKYSGLEIGIHPYFSRVIETQYESVVSKLKDIYKDAKGSRSHRNYFGYTTPKHLTNFGIEYDISVVNWLQPALCNRHFTGLKTVTYSWEDGLHFDYSFELSPKQIPYDNENYYIYNVHPISIYLNQNSEAQRKQAVKGITDLTSAKEVHLTSYVHKGYGLKNIIRDFVCDKRSIALKDFLLSS